MLNIIKRILITGVATLTIVFGALMAGLFWAASMPGQSASQDGKPADTTLANRLEAHVRTIAVERNTGKVAALEAAATYIENQIRRMGLEPQSQWFETAGVRVRNLFVILPGSDAAAPHIVIGAHYDSAPGTPGADDNASGVAALLEIARALKARPATDARATVHLVFFTNEEPPYFRSQQMGSYHYAESLVKSRTPVQAMMSLEMLGYYCDTPGCQRYPFPFSVVFPERGNFVGFVGNIASRELVRNVVGRFRQGAAIASEGVTAPTFVTGVDFSDQLWFWHFGMPAVMVTDTSFMRYAHYHRRTDTPEQLDYQRMALVVEGLVPVIADLRRQASSAK